MDVDEPVAEAWHLQLLDGWYLRLGTRLIELPRREQRLVAYLALHGVRLRSLVAGVLWPNSPEAHALSNLRTATVHVRHLAPGLLASDRVVLSLATAITVDVPGLLREHWGAAAVDSSRPSADAVAHELLQVGELLPGWYDDWVIYERERLRQAHIAALDHAAGDLIESGQIELALRAARKCVAMEPLRESSHRRLTQAYLANGARVEALRTYMDFRRHSISEFGLAPDPAFEALVAPLREERARRSQPEPR